jgi:hypothetical protein
MIFGPKNDGTYVASSRQQRALCWRSQSRDSEAAVQHFQEFVRDEP